VALIHGLGEFLGKHHADKGAVAEGACRLEMELLGEKIGKQDQYAAAFGGINFMEFSPSGVTVKPIRLSKKRLLEFNAHLALFHVGGGRSAANYSDVLTKNLTDDKEKFGAQKAITDYVVPFKNALLKGDYRKLSKIISEGWELKKKTSGLISDKAIDAIYETGMKNGAWGGKLLGAGGGGFLLFVVPPRNRAKLIKALHNVREVPFAFDMEGSKTVFSRFKGVV
jgi:D-glycero-alpha-D-manno-heptose-7-phosphate kinase